MSYPIMERLNVRIESIVDHPDLVPMVAGWRWDEWGLEADPEGSAKDWAERLSKQHRSTIPTTFIALDELAGRVGVVSLTANDMAIRPKFSPWLAGLYVPSTVRRNGIGAALVRHAEARAKALQVARLYLFTDTAESLYGRLGWHVVERVTYRGRTQTVMVKALLNPV